MKPLLTAILLSLCPLAASAYVEDLCISQDGKSWANCSSDPCAAEDESPVCGAATLASSFSPQVGRGAGVRSTLHFDATYFLAQAAGFTPRDAYVIAAYDDATDEGQYVHRDQNAQLPVDPTQCTSNSSNAACQLNSAVIEGVTRNNFIEGGLFFHFMASAIPADMQEGLHPDPADAHKEPFLHALRQWVYGEGPLCVAGLLDPTGNGCFVSSSRNPSILVGHIPIVADTGIVTSIDWVSTIGEQKVGTAPDGSGNEPASSLGNLIPAADLPLARLGIFLHAIADRVSHHRCIDVSDVDGPRSASAGPVLLNPLTQKAYEILINLRSSPQDYLLPLFSTPPLANPDYIYTYDNTQCDQLHHFLRHAYETGHDHRALQLQNQTAKYGLLAVFDELIKFAQAKRIPHSRNYDSTQREALVDSILDATDTVDAQARVNALTATARAQGWLPLPLYDGLTQAQWQQRAGKAQFSSQDSSGGGAFNPMLLLPLMLAALARQRRRSSI